MTCYTATVTFVATLFTGASVGSAIVSGLTNGAMVALQTVFFNVLVIVVGWDAIDGFRKARRAAR